MLILEKTCITTLLWVVELLCSQVSLKDSARKSLLWPHLPWRLRYSLHKRESSWFGSVGQSCHHCLLSRLCGLQRLSIVKAAQKSFTESVSDQLKTFIISQSSINLFISFLLIQCRFNYFTEWRNALVSLFIVLIKESVYMIWFLIIRNNNSEMKNKSSLST